MTKDVDSKSFGSESILEILQENKKDWGSMICLYLPLNKKKNTLEIYKEIELIKVNLET